MTDKTCSERDDDEVARIVAFLAPDMAAHPEEYTAEAVAKRTAGWSGIPEDELLAEFRKIDAEYGR